MELSKIAEMLAEICDTPAEEITEDTAFADLGIDSLDITEVVMKVEDEYGITLQEDDAFNVKTVGDVVKLVEDKIK